MYAGRPYKKVPTVVPRNMDPLLIYTYSNRDLRLELHLSIYTHERSRFSIYAYSSFDFCIVDLRFAPGNNEYSILTQIRGKDLYFLLT